MSLVLERHAGETVFIGEDIAITVIRTTRSGRVFLSIDAPTDVAIRRDDMKKGKQPIRKASKHGNDYNL